MAADIQIIVETIGEESIERAISNVYKLERRVDSLASAWARGKINGNQFQTGLSEIVNSIDTTSAAGKRLKAQVESYGQAYVKASSRGNIFTRMLRSMTGQTEATTRSLQMSGLAMNQFGIQASRAQTKFKRFGSVGLQQVGYQVGDFAVQIQGGTNALVALGQQGSQLLGILGPMGAIAGAALAIWTAIARVKQETSSTGLVMEKVWEDLRKAIEPIRGVLTSMGDALSWVGDQFINFANLVLNNMQRVFAYMTGLVAVIGTKMVAAWVASGAAAIAFARVVRLALVSTGIGILAVAIGELVYRFMKAGSDISGVGEFISKVWMSVKDVLHYVFEVLGADATAWIKTAQADMQGFKQSFLQVFYDILLWLESSWIGTLLRVINGAVMGIGETFAIVKDLIANPFKDGLNDAIQVINDFGRKLQGNSLVKAIGSISVEGSFFDLISREQDLLKPLEEVTVTWESSAQRIRDAVSEGFNQEFRIPILGNIDEIRTAITTAEDQAEAYRNAARVADVDMANASDKLKVKFKELVDLFRSGASDIDITEWFGKIDEATERTGSKVEETMDRIKSAYEGLSKSIEGAFSDFFNSLVDGTKTVADAFKDMARKILAALWDVLVTQQIVNSIMGVVNKFIPGMQGAGITGGVSNYTSGMRFADGGAFSNGRLLEFADGGIVNRPTLFPMANGMGLMGEAGPEAVMPLKRGRDGKLGVAAQGGGGDTYVINQSFNFSANGDDSVKRILLESAPQISNFVKRDIIASRQRGGQMRQVFR